MRNLLLILLLFVVTTSLNAQTLINKTPEKYIGLQARLIDLMPFELSYLSVKSVGFSFAIRGGYGSGTKNNIKSFYTNNYFYNSNSYITKYDQNFEAFFIKPGIIISKNRTPIFTTYYLINYSYAQSNDHVSITSQDQLYGVYNKEFNEKHVYQAIEFEGNYQLKFTGKIYLGLGYIFGYKLVNEVPFTSVIKGIENGSQYSPSQGHGVRVYVNANASIMFKL